MFIYWNICLSFDNVFQKIFKFHNVVIISEYSLSTSETHQIEYLTNGALATLGHYCLQRMEWTRFGKLLLALRCLSLRPFDTALKHLFNHIIDHVIESKWIKMVFSPFLFQSVEILRWSSESVERKITKSSEKQEIFQIEFISWNLSFSKVIFFLV